MARRGFPAHHHTYRVAFAQTHTPTDTEPWFVSFLHSPEQKCTRFSFHSSAWHTSCVTPTQRPCPYVKAGNIKGRGCRIRIHKGPSPCPGLSHPCLGGAGWCWVIFTACFPSLSLLAHSLALSRSLVLSEYGVDFPALFLPTFPPHPPPTFALS